MKKITSADCISFGRNLPQFQATKPANWKRRLKKVINDTIIRVFEVDKETQVAVVEKQGRLVGVLEIVDKMDFTAVGIAAPKKAYAVAIKQTPAPDDDETDEAAGLDPRKLLAKLQANPIKVNLTNPVEIDHDTKKPMTAKEADFSGRVVYGLGEEELVCYNSNLKETDNGVGNKGDGEFVFDCGPETTDKCMHDSYDGGCYEQLRILFADFPKRDDFERIDVGAAENSHNVRLIPGISAQELWDVIKARLERSGAIPFEGDQW